MSNERSALKSGLVPVTRRYKMVEFARGVGFLVGGTLMTSTLCIWLLEMMGRLNNPLPLLVPLFCFGFLARVRSRNYLLNRSMFVTEVVLSAALVGVVFFLVTAALFGAAGGV